MTARPPSPQLRPKRPAQSGGFTLIELMITVSVIGILAAVAGPNLGKYTRRAKTSEAVVNLKRLFDGSTNYYYRSQDMTTRDGTAIAPQFPGLGVPPSPAPAERACCDQPGQKCAPADAPGNNIYPGAWNNVPWPQLGFSVTQAHYYWYEYVTDGSGINAGFTARAMGDLNCNFITSVFERVGGVNQVTGEVIGGGGVFVIRPLE